MPAIREGYISVPGAEAADRPVAAPREPRPSVESANLRMWLPLVGLGLGILLGLTLNVSVTPDLARYSAVAILAGLDSILGAVRAELDGHYDNRIFISGFIANTAVAVLLTFVGDRLGIDLYLVALIAFGLRIFQNVALIRRHFL
jgi:small basic protein